MTMLIFPESVIISPNNGIFMFEVEVIFTTRQ
ncbi:Uncharacterised protein [Escherichia coli]|nr:Uncharacterised protein [Escherichia coli]